MSVERQPNNKDKFLGFTGPEILGVAGSCAFEGIRLPLINPQLGGILEMKSNVETLIHPGDLLYTPVSHLGDFFPGYFAAMVGLGIMNGIDVVAQKSLKKKIPLKVKLTASLLAGIGIVLMAESGVGRSGPDYWDIPAGVAGAVTLTGLSAVSRKNEFNISSESINSNTGVE